MKVSFHSGPAWDTVEIEPLGEHSGLTTELGQVLTAHGAEPRGTAFVLSRLDLRRCASELGVVLQRHGASGEYDSSVRSLLVTHVEEISAREASTLTTRIRKSDLRKLLSNSRFRRILKDNQVRNVCRLLALRHGANFSVPGAGKTATLLAVYEALRVQLRVERLMVVLPKNALLAWEDELVECFPNDMPSSRRLTGGREGVIEALQDDPEICFVTYQLLPNVYSLVAEWCNRHKTHVVLDEAHRVKAGLSGVLAAAAIRLSSASVRRDILTGTPLPQSPEDLRAQIEFLWPGQRILPDQRIDSTGSTDAIAEVQSRVAALYVRTTKNDLGLRPPDIMRVSVPLGPLQGELYELLRSEAKRVAAGMSQRDRAFLRHLGRHVVRLLEAASNPILLTRGALFDDEDSNGSDSPNNMRAFDLLRTFARHEKPAKLKTATDLCTQILQDDAEHKVLIWSSFIQNILTLERAMSAWNPVVLYGAVGTGDEEDPDTREGRIRQFHRDPRCRVMIANPAACGEGISLHRACHHAIYVDRTFNAAHYLQSIDRIHRLGLGPDQVTKVFLLEAEATIDARVAARLHAKITAMSSILNDPGLAALAYDPEDVVEEFPAGLEAGDVDEVVDHLVQKDNTKRG